MFPPSPFSPPEENLPFRGIATFAGYPLWREDSPADAVVLGVPYDEGTTYRPGTRFGPRAIRDASMFYSYEGTEGRFYDADRRCWLLAGKRVVDAGDVEIEPLCLEKNLRSVTAAVHRIVRAKAVPALMGGDHSITFPALQGFDGRPFHYLHLDSHIDCDRISYSKFTHGSPLLNIFEQRLAESITIIGVRGLSNSGQDMEWIEEQGVKILTARKLRRLLTDPEAGGDLFAPGSYYVSVDIDFFDPGVAPGTGTPEPGGFQFQDFSDLLYRLKENGQIIGFDVVEVNPYLDGRGAVTAHLAARCMLELLGLALMFDNP